MTYADRNVRFDGTENPMNASQLLASARQWQQAGDMARAEAAYRDLLSIDPHNAELWYLTGTVCQAQGKAGEGSRLPAVRGDQAGVRSGPEQSGYIAGPAGPFARGRTMLRRGRKRLIRTLPRGTITLAMRSKSRDAARRRWLATRKPSGSNPNLPKLTTTWATSNVGSATSTRRWRIVATPCD